MTFRDVVASIDNYKRVWRDLGETLGYCRDNFGELVGEGVNTWRDFLEQPEIGLTVREANRLIQLAEWLDSTELPVEDLNLATANFAASRGIYDADLVEDMKVLSLRDFKERYTDEKKTQNRTYEYMVMKRCKETGSLQKVYEEELEEALKNI